MEKSIKKKNNVVMKSLILSKVIFQTFMLYIDIISDYRLLYAIYEITLYDPIWKNSLYLVCLFQIIERVYTYVLLKDITKQNKF